MEQDVDEQEPAEGEDEMEVPEGLEEEDMGDEQYDEDDENNYLRIDEDQLHALIVQYEQQMQGLPTEPIYNQDGELIVLNQEEYELALQQF